MPVTFDTSREPIYLIVLDPTEPKPTAASIYTDWKEWVLTGAGAGIVQAFDSQGNDEIDPNTGLNVGAYFFFRNDLGWRIKPPEQDGEWDIQGNLLPRDPNTAFRIKTDGAFNTSIDRTVSALVFEKQIDSGSGLTAQQADQLLEMWRRLDLDATNPNTYADDASSINNSDFTLTRTDNGNGTSTVTRS